tara:strand:- start:6785 stop:8440 length:1656 start_codon:yes stop_codon:yes gene_type:complete
MNTEGNIFKQKPNDNLRDNMNGTEENAQTQGADKKTPQTVRKPNATATAPLFTQQERIGYTLIPLASALLQGKRSGGGSLLNDTLGSLGQGLMGTADMALRIKQLEGKKRETGTGVKNVKLQPTAGQVEIQGQIYTPEMGREFTLDEATRLMYPPDTFMEVSSDKKGTIKTETFSLFYVGTKDEAKRLYPNNPTIQDLIVAKDDNQIGQPVIQNNKRLAANVIFKDGNQIEERLDFVSKQPVGTTTDSLGQPIFQKDRASAVAYLKSLGINEDISGYEAVINKLINPAKAGKPVFESGVGLVVSARRPDVAGSNIEFISLAPEKDLKDARFIANQDAVKKLNKVSTDLSAQVSQMSGRVEQVMNLLLGGTPTGRLEELLLPFRSFLRDVVGMTQEEREKLSAQQAIQKSAFALAPLMRQAGAGSTSDMEFNAYMSAAVRLGDTPRANYISLYMLNNIKKNAERVAALRTDLLVEGKTAQEIKEAVDAQDPGLFKTYKGETDRDAIREWSKTLKRGDVVFNMDRDGNPIYTVNGVSAGSYVVVDGQGGLFFQ